MCEHARFCAEVFLCTIDQFPFIHVSMNCYHVLLTSFAPECELQHTQVLRAVLNSNIHTLGHLYPRIFNTWLEETSAASNDWSTVLGVSVWLEAASAVIGQLFWVSTCDWKKPQPLAMIGQLFGVSACDWMIHQQWLVSCFGCQRMIGGNLCHQQWLVNCLGCQHVVGGFISSDWLAVLGVSAWLEETSATSNDWSTVLDVIMWLEHHLSH